MKGVRRTRSQSVRANPQGKSSYCYWSVADGEFALMAETMVASARKAGVTTEFHIWSDQEIAGAIVHPVRGFKKDHYLFKLEFLRDHVAELPHDYFVWLDADNYFVRDPGNILRVLDGAPMHASLESDLCGPDNIQTRLARLSVADLRAPDALGGRARQIDLQRQWRLLDRSSRGRSEILRIGF